MIIILLLFAAGLALSAFFSGSETGFYRLTRLRLVMDALTGDRSAKLMLRLANQPSLFVATALVGNNVANYLSSLAVVMGVQRWFPTSGTLGELAAPVIVAPVLFIFGELLPKNAFFAAPHRLMRRAAPVIAACVVLFAPVTLTLWALSQLARLISGRTPQEVQGTLARREIAELLDEGHEAGILLPIQRTLTQRMLAVAGQPVRNFASPAGRVVRVTTQMSKSEILRIAQRHGRTLMPVEDPAQKRKLVGYVRTIDMYLHDDNESPQPRPVTRLLDTESFLSALGKLSEADDALGHVVTAAGKTVGFVTGRELRLTLFRAQALA
ncbi:MAG: hemolysin protein [Planctomycetaceae bacterium]|nr:hemolysin protein [Planctomycetaceae bacterium]